MDTNLIKQIERPSLREQVYQGLKKAIIMLELKPGQRVNDNELAALFGVSRTPVREALKRLEDEGLIESVPGSLTRVTPLLEKEAKHAFPVVAALHGLAARLAMPFESEIIRSLEQWNEKLQVALEQQDVIKAIGADDGFHDVILEAAGNREIYLALERVVPKIRRLEFARFGSLEGVESVEQHRRIIEAIRDNNSQLASSLMEENWINLGRLLTVHSNDE